MLRYLDITDLMKRLVQENAPVGMVLGYYIDRFWLPPNHWVLDKSKSGGQVVEHTTHIFDLARYVVGEVSRVHAEFDNILLKHIPNVTMENEAITILRFKNGAVGMICGIWSSVATHMFTKLEAYCKDLVVERSDMKYLKIYKHKEVREIISSVDPYFEEDVAFIKAVKEDKPELIKCPYEDGVKTLRVTLAANEATRERKVIFLE